MYIEDERKKDMACFAVIKVGEAFQYDNDIYMKVADVNATYNAVDLLSGTIHFLLPEIKVIPLDAKVVIQNDI